MPIFFFLSFFLYWRSSLIFQAWVAQSCQPWRPALSPESSSTACGVVYRAVAPVFSAHLGLCVYAEGKSTPRQVCPLPWSFPFPLCLPCQHQWPQVDIELHRDTSGGVWLCRSSSLNSHFLTALEGRQESKYVWSGSDWQQDHVVCSADPVIWKQTMLKKKKGTVIKGL